MITDYQSLQDTIVAWLDRASEAAFEAHVPTFIQLAEEEMNMVLRVREMRREGDAVLNEAAEWLPPSYLELWGDYCIYYAPVDIHGKRADHRIYYLSPLAFQDKTVSASHPVYFTITGNKIKFKPEPVYDPDETDEDKLARFELFWTGRLDGLGQPLDPDDPDNVVIQNDILAKYPNLYLYGSLMYADEFVDAATAKRWEGRFRELVTRANAASVTAENVTGGIGRPY